MALAACVTLLHVAGAFAAELTRGDRLAILYSPQLRFTPAQEPLIRVGLMEGEASVRVSADTPVEIDPMGDGGVSVVVPAATELTVSIESAEPGGYTHGVIVAELLPSQRSEAQAALTAWASRGFAAEVLQVGAVFAVSGQRFDTRRLLVVVGRTDDQARAAALRDRIEEAFGVAASLHSELTEYPGGRFVVAGLPGGVVVRSDDLVWLRGSPATVFTVRDVVFDRGTRTEGRESRRYVGSLIFAADRNGRISLINELPLERLVEGILPSEMYPSAPSESLRAQAVAARSEVLGSLGVRYLADPYMTCADQRCQVYKGIGAEVASTTAAARATRGQVLSDGDVLIRASFSANNGGFAGGNDTTWGDAPLRYLQPRYDAGSPDDRYDAGLRDEAAVRAFLEDPGEVLSNVRNFGNPQAFRWSVELSVAQLTEAVSKRLNVGEVRELEPLDRDGSGRVTRLRVVGARGEAVVERELNIRRTLGGLRSALFVIDPRRDAGGRLQGVVIRGGGFGHGVGMCQTGAVGAAQRGWSFERILSNYYPGTSLRKLY
jgi:SpoIID/LytB domain protein